MSCLRCFPSKKGNLDIHVPNDYDSFSFAQNLAAAGVEPVLRNTRDIAKDEVRMQRQKSMQMSHAPSLSREGTRFALQQPPPKPLTHRMSRIGSMSRGMLVKNLEAMSKEPKILREPSLGTASGLTQRLESLGMSSVEMAGDGNCQFRAVADQLFGSQEHHRFVRHVAVTHMRDVASDFFGIYFETPEEYDEYIAVMGRSRTWGDELTLRACVEAFGCVAHVVTSEDANWYLVYTPEAQPDEAALAALCAKKSLAPPRSKKEIFVSYISPIHYNAIAALTAQPV